MNIKQTADEKSVAEAADPTCFVRDFDFKNIHIKTHLVIRNCQKAQ